MGKIIAVDFKNKQKQMSWDDDREMRQIVTAQVHKDFEHVLDKIIYLTDNDREFQLYCARTLAGIVGNLKHRL